jgi:hypothetical protein
LGASIKMEKESRLTCSRRLIGHDEVCSHKFFKKYQHAQRSPITSCDSRII